MTFRHLRVMAAIGLLVLMPGARAVMVRAQAPPAVTTPQQEFGHNFGDDYFLANYQQLSAYWQKLARQSDRMVLQSIGKTAEGRDQLMAIITAPENFKKLDRYKEISRRLATVDNLTDVEANR